MWRKPTIEDLKSSLSEKEIGAFDAASTRDVGGALPCEAIIARTVALARGYVMSSPKRVRVSPDIATLPESLIAPAMDYAAIDILKRLPVEIAKPRLEARDKAIELFKAIASGDFTPESYGGAAPGQDSVTLASASRRRVTSRSLEETP